MDVCREHTFNFVFCPPYHGATLLACLLNNHTKVSSLGDTLPERGHLDYFCSCGAQIRNCQFWNELGRKTNAERFPREKKLLPLVPRLIRTSDENDSFNERLIYFA